MIEEEQSGYLEEGAGNEVVPVEKVAAQLPWKMVVNRSNQACARGIQPNTTLFGMKTTFFQLFEFHNFAEHRNAGKRNLDPETKMVTALNFEPMWTETQGR